MTVKAAGIAPRSAAQAIEPHRFVDKIGALLVTPL
jgi:hypothetical protein